VVAVTADREHVGELVAELRQLADALIDRVDPWLRAAAQDDPGEHASLGCGWCPVCALVSAVRGDRPELSRRLAEQGSGVLVALRALLEQHPHGECLHTPPDGAAGESTHPAVQRIPVRRSGSAG